MSNLIKPKSINEYGGIKPYLNDLEIKARHNGYGFDDLIKNQSRGLSFLAKLFSPDPSKPLARTTIARWLARVNQDENSGRN